MNRTPITEVFALDPERKWEYLGRYYKGAVRFYEAAETVVDEAEVAATIRRLKEKPAPRIRRDLRLRDWVFRPDVQDEGLAGGFYSRACAASDWEPVTVPHSFNHVPSDPIRFDKDTLLGEYRTWYRARVPGTELREGEVAYLQFDSVHLLSDVWVNEEAVMLGHLGPYPFRVTVTDELGRGTSEEALVAVRVTYQASNQPEFFSNGLQLAYADPHWKADSPEEWESVGWSGLAGDVTLSIRSATHLEEAFLFTQALEENRAQIICRLTVRNTSRRPFAGRVRIEISEWLPEESDVLHMVRQDVAVLPTNEVGLEVPVALTDPRLWCPDSPGLYLARTVLEGADGRELDDQVETFGVRTIGFRGPHFLLNGEPFVPRGTHDMTRYFGDSMVCPSDRNIAMDLLLHKGIGATCTRWPSDTRMHYARIADYCDQFGLMLSWCGFFEVWKVHPDMEMLAHRDVKATIRSLRNHPSIFCWEMGDEPLMNRDTFRRIRWYEQVHDLVADEDQSRPIIPAGWYASSDLVGPILWEKDQSLSLEERREQALRENPIFTHDLSVWDCHYCPGAGPLRRPLHVYVDEVAAALGGLKPTVLTEFGLDALPNYDKVRRVYRHFRWPSYGMGMGFDRAPCDISYFGRPVTESDWRETQASQALFYETIIGRIREHPRAFAAFYLVMMTDVWTLCWGLTDILGNPKLSYFVAKALYAPIFISALHGNSLLRSGDSIELVASNFGPPQDDAVSGLQIKDDTGMVVREVEFGPAALAGGIDVTPLGSLEVAGLTPGLYRVESHLHSRGERLARRLEMFYLDPTPSP